MSHLFKILVPGLLLASVSGPLLAQTPWSTDLQEEWLHEVMPGAQRFADKAGDPPVFRAYADRNGEEQMLGYVFLSADVPPQEKGYSAPIDMLIGVDSQGEITGLKILDYVESFKHSRGDFLATEGFQEQFTGKPLNDEFRVRSDLDSVTGATISSWAVARGARQAARRVAGAYTDYQAGSADERRWEANARERLAQHGWDDLRRNGTIRKLTVSVPVDRELDLYFAYMGRPLLGQYYIGEEAYEQAERDASLRFDTPELLLVGVAGESRRFDTDRFSIRQGDQGARRVHPRRFVGAGDGREGLFAGHVDFAGAIVMEDRLDLSQPFTILYQAAGSLEEQAVDYRLNDLSLTLAKDEPVASVRALRLADAGWLTRLRLDPPWGETPWLKVLMMSVLLGLVLSAFLSKNSPLRWLALSTTLVHLGFWDGGFLSVSHITGALTQGPGIFLNDLPILILVLFTLITTLLWGRVFCSSLCPFGALQDIIARLVPRRWRIAVPQVIHDRALYLKYGFLALILLAAVASGASIFQYFEPFGTLFFFSGSVLLWAILLAILVGCVFVERFYCRYVCPLGAALGVLSLISPLRIKRVPQCDVCTICQNACPTGAIRREEIDFKECVRCDICESKLIRQAGACRHSVEEINRRGKGQVIAVG